MGAGIVNEDVFLIITIMEDVLGNIVQRKRKSTLRCLKHYPFTNTGSGQHESIKKIIGHY